MKVAALALLLGSAVVLPAGCKTDDGTGSKKSPANTIGVVDFDKLGDKMGWNDELKQNLAKSKTSLEDDLKAYLNYRVEELKTKRADIAKAAALSGPQKDQLDKPHTALELKAIGLSDAQIDELAAAEAQVKSDEAKVNQTFSQIMQEQSSKIVRAFQEAAQPSIRRVASRSGRDVILLPQTTVYVDPQVDLTDQVADDIQHTTNGTKIVLPPIPKIDITYPDKDKPKK